MSARETVTLDKAGAWLSSYLESATAAGAFSGAVAVYQDGEEIFCAGYGFADIAAERANECATQFRVASVGKMFTAHAALLLAEEGWFDLERPISSYIPQFPPEVGDELTPRHLLTHTSGYELDDYPPYNEAVRAAQSVEDILEAQIRFIEHLNEGRYADFALLGTFDYSNENFDLLGAILERVERRRCRDILRRRSLKPAGVSAVAFSPPNRAARGYTALAERASRRLMRDLQDNAELVQPRARPAGSHYASAHELALYLRFLETARRKSSVLDEATRQQALVGENGGAVFGYGLGFETETHPCFRSYGHTGSEAGASATARTYPAAGLVIVTLANRDGVAFDIHRRIEEALLGC